MARLALIVAVFVLASAGVQPAEAQSEREYGFTLAFNRATLQSTADLGMHSAFAFGAVVRQPVSGPVALQAELLLNQKGTEVDSDEGGGIAYGAGYLELPVLVHVASPRIRSVRLYGEAGGYGGLKMFERQTPAAGELNIDLNTGTSFYRRVDAGGIAGLGATVPLGEQRLSFIVRRSWGVIDVARDVNDQPFPEAAFPSSGETRTWSLHLRFGF